MSAIGPKRTCLVAPHMSAFGGKADIAKPFQKGQLGSYNFSRQVRCGGCENLSARTQVLTAHCARADRNGGQKIIKAVSLSCNRGSADEQLIWTQPSRVAGALRDGLLTMSKNVWC